MRDVGVIVLAAGTGERFGEPKQFAELKPGVRLVDAALQSAFEATDTVVLVLPEGYQWHGRPVFSVVTGGESRLDSVTAGLNALPEDREIVVIHDAAHPLASRQTFQDVIDAIRNGADAAVPFLPVADVVKRIDKRGSLSTVGRDGLGLAQVPMAFSYESLKSAHGGSIPPSSQLWEDSMLVEQAKGQVIAVPGNSMNIHVISPDDLVVARKLSDFGAPLCGSEGDD